MRVAISGASGLIGSALRQALTERGHTVLPIVRRAAAEGEIQWDPSSGLRDARQAEGLDALVHLAGVGIADQRWSETRKRAIYESRVNGTTTLFSSLSTLQKPPKRILAGSAIGYYGSRGDEELDESSAAGDGFLARLTVDWEGAAEVADRFADRVYFLRTGIVLSTEGGALPKMLTPFKLGVGGVIGSGDQYMSWISIDDEVGAIIHLLSSELESGPVNLTAPAPVTNREFTKALGRALGRPTIFPLPAFVVRTVFGEMGEEALLGSARVLPGRLEADGFDFSHRQLDEALSRILT